MIIREDIEQGTPSWFQAKAGRPGASSFDRIITTTGKESKSRTDYLYELAGEKILDTKENGFASFAMRRGIEMEAEAREFYGLVTGAEIQQVGLIYKDETERVLCSPDGLMENTGLEIKCLMLKTHVKYLLDGKLPTEYFCQVQGSMYVTGFKTWQFMSYFPGMPPFIIEAVRDEAWICALDAALERFLAELDGVHKQLLDRL